MCTCIYTCTCTCNFWTVIHHCTPYPSFSKYTCIIIVFKFFTCVNPSLSAYSLPVITSYMYNVYLWSIYTCTCVCTCVYKHVHVNGIHVVAIKDAIINYHVIEAHNFNTLHMYMYPNVFFSHCYRLLWPHSHSLLVLKYLLLQFMSRATNISM